MKNLTKVEGTSQRDIYGIDPEFLLLIDFFELEVRKFILNVLLSIYDSPADAISLGVVDIRENSLLNKLKRRRRKYLKDNGYSEIEVSRMEIIQVNTRESLKELLDQLNFGEYIDIIIKEDFWRTISSYFSFSSDEFRKKMLMLKGIRNMKAHIKEILREIIAPLENLYDIWSSIREFKLV